MKKQSQGTGVDRRTGEAAWAGPWGAAYDCIKNGVAVPHKLWHCILSRAHMPSGPPVARLRDKASVHRQGCDRDF